MEIEFFRQHKTRRVRDYEALPFLLEDGQTLTDDVEGTVGLDCEVDAPAWQPKDLGDSPVSSDWTLRPRRFIDGKDVGSTVAWLQSDEGYPVPVRLSQIGAVALRVVDGELRREPDAPVERVVSMIVDFFPWEEVESLARALRANGFRLLPSEKPHQPNPGDQKPRDLNLMFDFERMRKTTQNRSNDEMLRLERQLLASRSDVATLVDGRLEPRAGAFDESTAPVIGLIKTHREQYLHRPGWRTFYDLRPGQRTPAFLLEGGNLKLAVVTWYLRLDGDRGELPNWGVVRVELARRFFDQQLKGDWSNLDRLSRCIRDYRCRDSGYGRAPVSLHPIQRAEESLGALFSESATLAQHFYRRAGL